MVLEVYGSWGEEFRTYFEQMLGIIADAEEGKEEGDEWRAARFADYWQKRISVTLQRGNALAIIHRVRCDKVRAGTAVMGRRPVHFDYDSDAA